MKFDGAPAPKDSGGHSYGQRTCYVWFGARTRYCPVYRLDSDGEYHWGYSSADYDRFSITDYFALGIDDGKDDWGPDRRVWTEHLQGEISYPNPGKAEFYIAYELSWSVEHYPTGYDPATHGLTLVFEYTVWHGSETTSSTVDNVKMRIVSGKTASPQVYYYAWFEAASPGNGWVYCHQKWAVEPLNPARTTLSDSKVYLLIGFRDAWDADWQQGLKVYLRSAEFMYNWETW